MTNLFSTFCFWSLSRSTASLWLNVSEGVLLFFGGVLVIGLLGEYSESTRLKKCLKAFKWMVVIGVSGELIADGGIFLLSARLQTITDLEVAHSNEEAKKAGERASANEKEAARLRKLTQDESLARLQLEAELAWRRISKDSQSATAAHLVRLPGQLAQISYNAADLEAQSFAADIASALRGAKWEVFEPQGIANMHQVLVTLRTDTPLEAGVTVTSTKNRTSRAAASALVQELSALGFDATLSPTKFQQPTSTVFIFVGRRPDGIQGEFKLRGQTKPGS
jgi:hypothetical protein